tara:strand:- start:2422 stop:2658 length:237 start_codon:yes stop_codon:yes gene_type:complete
MDPTPYFIMGLLCGTTATLMIQAYGRRKVARATAQIAVSSIDQDQQIMTHELRERVKVLEQIITDQPARLADRIESLR